MAAQKVDFSTPADLTALKGKNVLVTGGSSGIGAACVRTFAENGCSVTIADLNDQAGEDYAKALRDEGFQVVFVHTDVTDWTSQVDAFKEACQATSKNELDIVLACAGVAGTSFSSATDPESPSDVKDPQPPATSAIMVNQTGTLKTAKLAFHHFDASKKSGSKKPLIFLGSMAGYSDVPNEADYSSSKWGVRGIFRALRSESGNHGARVNLVAPTFIETSMTKNMVTRLEQMGVKFGKMEDVVAAVMRLSTDDTINGRAVAVGAYGNFDLRDDMSGGNAAFAMREYYETGAFGAVVEAARWPLD
ncbi:MAG: trifunctional dihydropteroate synthetase [Chaenotheca gracillima]|nr:MAG: trifunctional dihydropteroate synthetase [Chaenotheca gracillima]